MFIPLTFIASTTGMWVAIVFITIFIFKAALAVIGGDFDSDLDIDGDVDVDVMSDGLGVSTSDFFSLKGFLNFGVGFSTCWALFGLNSWWNSILAILVGFATMLLLLYVYKLCMKMEGNIVTENVSNLVGRTGTVYTTNKNSLIIQIACNGRIDELLALPSDDSNIKDFISGDSVVVTSVNKNENYTEIRVKKI